MSLHKKSKTKTKNVFVADSKTCRVFWGFEQFFSTINWVANWCKNSSSCV